ncbi:hypothetical protein Tco_0524302 [Tanacetum coccineum]
MPPNHVRKSAADHDGSGGGSDDRRKRVVSREGRGGGTRAQQFVGKCIEEGISILDTFLCSHVIRVGAVNVLALGLGNIFGGLFVIGHDNWKSHEEKYLSDHFTKSVKDGSIIVKGNTKVDFKEDNDSEISISKTKLGEKKAVGMRTLSERISKKRTKNEAKTTKPDTEWKSVEKTKSKSKPKCQKVNPSQPRQIQKSTSEEK